MYVDGYTHNINTLALFIPAAYLGAHSSRELAVNILFPRCIDFFVLRPYMLSQIVRNVLGEFATGDSSQQQERSTSLRLGNPLVRSIHAHGSERKLR